MVSPVNWIPRTDSDIGGRRAAVAPGSGIACAIAMNAIVAYVTARSMAACKG